MLGIMIFPTTIMHWQAVQLMLSGFSPGPAFNYKSVDDCNPVNRSRRTVRSLVVARGNGALLFDYGE